MGEETDAPGHFRLNMDGDWDLDDLGGMATSIRLSFAYFYWLFKEDPTLVDSIVKSGIARTFWSGEYPAASFAQTLYDRIPPKDRLRIVSIHYASPGWLELATTAIGVIGALGFVTRVWITNADKAIEVMRKIDQFFADRKLRQIREGSIHDVDGAWVDEARNFCFEFGRFLGLDDARIEATIELVGNPIAALKLLVAISREARKIYQLAQQGKVRLPGTPSPPAQNDGRFDGDSGLKD